MAAEGMGNHSRPIKLPTVKQQRWGGRANRITGSLSSRLSWNFHVNQMCISYFSCCYDLTRSNLREKGPEEVVEVVTGCLQPQAQDRQGWGQIGKPQAPPP